MILKTIQKFLFVTLCSSMLFSCYVDELDDDTNDNEEKKELFSIATADDLYRFASRVNDGENELNAELTADIDISGNEWIPIGYKGSNRYLGVFQGNGHIITGLTITEKNKIYEYGNFYSAGLFGRIGSGGKVMNVKLKDVSILLPNYYSIGGIAGNSEGEITNCTVSGSIGALGDVGGIAGLTSKPISNCINNADVKSYSVESGGVGGIVGLTSSHVISCKNYGKIEGHIYVGGIIGTSGKNSILFNLENYGDVSSEETNRETLVGGIVGRAACKIYNCVNYGKISGYWNIGGIVGGVTEGTYIFLEFKDDEIVDAYIENCVNLGIVEGTKEAHAIIGHIYTTDLRDRIKLTASIENCFYDANINHDVIDENASAIDENTLSTLNRWVSQKTPVDKNEGFKIWRVDENGKLVITKN